MRVQVGPVAAGSVTIWVAYARTVLAQALAHPHDRGAALPEEVIAGFEAFLDEWEDLASADTEFVWIADVEAERVEFLAHAWAGIVSDLAEQAEVRGFPLAPPEGDEFYQALVAALLDALAYEGRSMMEFSEQLRDGWPGLKAD